MFWFEQSDIERTSAYSWDELIGLGPVTECTSERATIGGVVYVPDPLNGVMDDLDYTDEEYWDRENRNPNGTGVIDHDGFEILGGRY